MFNLWGPENSTLREKVVEHLFLAELSKEMLLRRHKPFEVLRSEFDGYGYDTVVEADGIMRHVQFKHSRADSKVRKQKVNLALAEKPNGCVIWSLVDRDTMSLGPFFWLDGGPGQLGAKLGEKVASHTKGNKDGDKGKRAAIREVGQGQFDRVGSIAGLATMLFGCMNMQMNDPNCGEQAYWMGLLPIERRWAEKAHFPIGLNLNAQPPMMWIERQGDGATSHFLFADGSWQHKPEHLEDVDFHMRRNGFYELGGRYLGKRPPPGLTA